jgi:signal transduction histidine kinase
MGLLTMRERVYALGGSFSLRSRYGDGVQLRIEIPLAPGGLIEP